MSDMTVIAAYSAVCDAEDPDIFHFETTAICVHTSVHCIMHMHAPP